MSPPGLAPRLLTHAHTPCRAPFGCRSNSLYSALVNEQHKHVDRSRPDVSQSTDARAAPGSGEEEGKGPAPAGPAVAESRFNAPRHAAALSRIVRSCEAAMGEVDAAQDGGSLRDSDRPDEVLRVAGCVR